MREDLGVMLGATVNAISEDMNQRAQLTLDFGVNKVPTIQEAIDAVNVALEELKNMTGHDDWRVTTLSDFGFADTPALCWPPKQ